MVDFFGPKPRGLRPSPVDLNKLTTLAKLYRVGLKDTSFIKFNLNFFYNKWILDFELDPNIWTRFKSWSKYLDLDLKEKSKLVLLKK